MSPPIGVKNRRLVKGLCSKSRCGRPLTTKTMCEQCAQHVRDKVAECKRRKISSGLCREGCGRLLATKNHCRVCADLDIERVLARRERVSHAL